MSGCCDNMFAQAANLCQAAFLAGYLIGGLDDLHAWCLVHDYVVGSGCSRCQGASIRAGHLDCLQVQTHHHDSLRVERCRMEPCVHWLHELCSSISQPPPFCCVHVLEVSMAVPECLTTRVGCRLCTAKPKLAGILANVDSSHLRWLKELFCASLLIRP